MIAEAIMKIKELALQGMDLKNKILPHPLNDQLYFYVDKNEQLKPVMESPPVSLKLSSLSSLAEFISDEDEKPNELSKFASPGHELIVHIESPTLVTLLTSFVRPWNIRFQLAEVHCYNAIDLDKYQSPEEFLIMLSTSFQETEELRNLRGLLSNIVDDKSVTYSDDGLTQTVTAKNGIASTGRKNLPNPVTLIPTRTFHEIDQVPGKFIVRIKPAVEGFKGDMPKIGLFTVDKQWEIVARQGIALYLEEQIQGPIATLTRIIW